MVFYLTLNRPASPEERARRETKSKRKITMAMKNKIQLIIGTLSLFSAVHYLNAQGTTFSYQGQLTDNGSPANGSYDLRFALFDAVTNSSAVSGTITNAATGVSNGLFAVLLDFGAGAFPGAPRFLEIGARTNGGG